MTIETALEKLDKKILIVLLLRVIDQFPSIKHSVIRMLNDKEFPYGKD